MMVKDEADTIGTVLRHLLRGHVDEVLISDNLSTDGTSEIIAAVAREFDGRVRCTVDEEVGYYQSEKMTALADVARSRGHSWVVPVDADEIWHVNEVEVHLRDFLHHQPQRVAVVEAALFDHVSTGSLADPVGDPFERMEWRRREAAPLPKVAVRLLPGLVIEQGNHGAHYPGQIERRSGLSVRHFPYRTVEQFVRKVVNGAAAYAATDLPQGMGRHWREYGQHFERGGVAAIREIFETWFHVSDPERHDATLIRDPAPIRR